MLKRIEVKNFKSLKHVDFKCVGLNLLMGLNGSGKSSFVQLLELMRVVARHGLKGRDEIAIGETGRKGVFSDLRYCYAPDEATIDVEMEFSRRIVVRERSDGSSILSDNTLFYVCEEGGIPILDETHTISRTMYDAGHGAIRSCHPAWRDKFLNSEEYREFLELSQMVDDDVDNKYFALFDKVNGLENTVEREIEREEGKIREDLTILWGHAQRIDAFRGKPECVHQGGRIAVRWGTQEDWRFDSEGEDVVEYLYKFGRKFVLGKKNRMRRCGDGAKKSRLIDEVNYWMSAVSPGARIEIEHVQCDGEEMLVENVSFGAGDEKRRFKPQNVGFGISYTLPVIVALLTAQPEDIIIIENPEAHLHPKGQAQMGELIAHAVAWGVQVFVETHSDHVMNGIRAAVKDGIVKPSDVNIAFFERAEHDVPNDDGTTHQEIYSEVRNIRVDRNGSLSEYPDGFMDEWNNQLMELI